MQEPFVLRNHPAMSCRIRSGTALLGILSAIGPVPSAEPARPGACDVVRDGSRVELRSPSFVLALDTAHGLRAVSLLNRLAGREVSLGDGPEFEASIDRGCDRISITGWRWAHSQDAETPPDEDRALRDGFHRPELDDGGWGWTLSPAFDGPSAMKGFDWARTRVRIPETARDEDLSLTVGGFGLFDFRFLRVFLNGEEVGRRAASGRWREPLVVDLGPRSPARALVRWGEENVVALQLSGFVDRLARLDELDPRKTREQGQRVTSAPQFEQCFTVGRLPPPLRFEALEPRVVATGESGRVDVELRSQDPDLTALVSYRWSAGDPVLRKTVEVINSGKETIRLLDVRLGSYRTASRVSEGEQGFPVYIDGHTFVGLAHPAGWATGQDGGVRLRQHPGKLLAPGEKLATMEWVLGAARAGSARDSFLAHLRGRMRRVVRGHDRPYAIFDNFGSWSPDLFTMNREEYVLGALRRVAESGTAAGVRFDFVNVHFWVDARGDLKGFDPQRFPRGLAEIRREVERIGAAPGLWIPATVERWSIHANPAVQGCCRAAEPFRPMFTDAFRHHIRENGVRLFKFDGLYGTCYSSSHGHLPGVYATEAIYSAAIETLRALDAECPDVFLLLYWSHLSPWWLLDGDTIFEPGLFMEAASPGPFPTLFARDSVTQGLDQGYLDGPAGHTIGRLRISVTSAAPPIALPRGYGSRPRLVRGRAPESSKGGALAIAVELSRGEKAAVFGDIGSRFSHELRISGEPARARAVLGVSLLLAGVEERDRLREALLLAAPEGPQGEGEVVPAAVLDDAGAAPFPAWCWLDSGIFKGHYVRSDDGELRGGSGNRRRHGVSDQLDRHRDGRACVRPPVSLIGPGNRHGSARATTV